MLIISKCTPVLRGKIESFHGVELADVQFGDSVLVIGIGPVGLMSVAGANMRGASRIIAVGTRPVCVEAAKKFWRNCPGKRRCSHRRTAVPV